MKTVLSSKSVTLVVGMSVCGVTGYLLYLLFKKDNDENDDYQNTYPKRSSYKTVDIRIPKEMVRELIGRNGKNIKAIQEESNTRINFKDEDEKLRTCVIRGSNDACAVAQNLIQEFITKPSVLECADIWVPQSAVSRIIGRYGVQITEISSRSGAKIDIAKTGRSEPTRRIVLKGTKEQINIAKSLIGEVVFNEQHPIE